MKHLNTFQRILRHPVNRNHAAAALLRYLRWQIGSRLVPGGVAVPFVNEAVLMISPGMHGATQNIYCGINDYQDMSFLLHLLRPGDLFVDVGANVGAYTVLASAAIGARSMACEPNPHTLVKFRRNVMLNGISDLVDERPVAVGAETKMIRLFTGTTDAMNRVVEDDQARDTIEVRQSPLDAMLDGRALRLLKVDVEGYEPAVLAGACRALVHPELLGVIVESNAEEQGRASPHAVLLGYGFQLCSYEPRTRTLLPMQNAGDNGLYVRDLQRTQSLLREAPSFTVFGERF
ncbi:MAG: FkbM family methyltransferase [Acidobacteriaceae bacterium]